MRCPICGHETEEKRKVCPTCGSRFKVVQITLSGSRKPVPYGKILLGLGLSFCTLTLCFLLTLFWEPGNLGNTGPSTGLPGALGETGAYISYDHHYTVFQSGGHLAYAYDHTTVQTHISNTGYELQHSLDGSTAALLANTGELLLFQGANCSELAMDVAAFALSSNGNAVLYLATIDSPIFSSIHYSLYYHHMDTGHVTTLVKGSDYGSIEDIAISPDGKTVAYILNIRRQRTLMRIVIDDPNSNLFQTQAIPLSNESLLAVANGWSGVYLVAPRGGLYDLVHYDENSNRSVLSNCGSYVSLSFNADNSQVLFYENASSYLSVNGGPPVKLSDYVVTPILPSNAQEIIKTDGFLSSTVPSVDSSISTGIPKLITYYPFMSFYEHGYYGMDGLNVQSAWYIGEERNEKIIPGPIVSMHLDPNGYLYYVTGQTLSVQHITQSLENRILISGDITNVQLEGDPEGKYLYFMRFNSFYLFDATTAGEPRLIYEPTDDSGNDDYYIDFTPIYGSTWLGTPRLHTDREGNLYFLVDDDLMVYDPKQDKVEACLQYIINIYGTPNGIVSIRPSPVSSFVQCIVRWDGTAMQYIYIS